MDDATARRHPLDVARADDAAVPHAVAVFDGPRQNVSDRFDAAMRMPGKARQVVLRNVIAEIIEEEKWIEVGRVAEAERAAQVDARPLDCRLRLENRLIGRMDMIIPYSKMTGTKVG